jgi:hypothetical protein
MPRRSTSIPLRGTTKVLLSAFVACLALASAPAEAARTRRLLDVDVLGIPATNLTAELRLYRTPAGNLLENILISNVTGMPVAPARMTPLGFSFPTGTTWGSYTAAPDGSVWAAFSCDAGIRVFDLGDLTEPGPLAPVQVDAFAAASGFDPRRTEMGIIAILIGLVAQPRPALSISDGTSNTMMVGWTGASFEPVVPVGDGTWTWE